MSLIKEKLTSTLAKLEMEQLNRLVPSTACEGVRLGEDKHKLALIPSEDDEQAPFVRPEQETFEFNL